MRISLLQIINGVRATIHLGSSRLSGNLSFTR
jgi:hypothetical protein